MNIKCVFFNFYSFGEYGRIFDGGVFGLIFYVGELDLECYGLGLAELVSGGGE